ncbi:MAG TPA: CIA30 family protein [Longimicrobiales bacterium]|nr:CIA30 family protein [Longimicrobiales bacterium]
MNALLDFRDREDVDARIVNDDVMGGRSSSRLQCDSRGFATFEGTLSLENHGGFASVWLPISPGVMENASGLLLRVRGDGRRYQARLRPGRRNGGVAWAANFETTAGEWITVELAMEEFEPTFRGYRPRGVGPVAPAEVGQVGIMLKDEQEGPFRLEIERVGYARGSVN